MPKLVTYLDPTFPFGLMWIRERIPNRYVIKKKIGFCAQNIIIITGSLVDIIGRPTLRFDEHENSHYDIE